MASGAALLFLSDGSQPLLFIVGTLLVVIGTLLLSPLALRAIGALAAPFPVAIRIALRDLARSQGRSAVALAAVTLSLGIPVGIAIVAGVAEADDAFPNLPDDQVLIWTKDPTDPSGVSPFYSEDTADEGFAPYLPDLDDRELDRLGAIVDRAAADVGGSAIPLEVVLDPKLRDGPEGRRAVVTVARRTDSGYLDVALLFRASPELLNLHSGNGTRDIMTVAPRGPEDIVTDTSSLWLSNTSDPPAEVTSYDTLDPTFSSLPASFISDHAVRERSWDARTIGWLITAERPVTPEELTNLRDLGSREGFLVEAAEMPRDLTSLRWGATAAGVLAASLVLAMTVGLIRLEAARDIRVLAASGASRRMRRSVTAATAGGLAITGAILGTLGAYVALGAGYVRDPAALAAVPVGPLAVVVVGVPVVATAVSWAVARDPVALGRPMTE